MTIKDLPEEERPRERLVSAGPDVLSNVELLAIILSTGTKTESAIALAGRMVAEFGGLRQLAEASVDELSKMKGVGLAKAAKIKAAVELGKRIINAQPEERVMIRSPQDVRDLLMGEMRYLDREHFKLVMLNTKHQVLKIATISIGSLNASIVHPREIFKEAMRRSTAAVIVVHNHPSGDPSPSREDIEVTKRLCEVGKLIGIEVLDHVIIGDNKYLSLKEKGII